MDRQRSSYTHTTTLRIVLLFMIHNHGVNGYQLADAKRLLKNKTADYEKSFRPVLDQYKPLKIYTGFDLVSIQEFDERQKKLTVTGIIYTGWTDELFNWDPDDFNGVTYLIIESSRVWTPALVMTNAMDEMDKLSEDWHQLVIYSSGWVEYRAGGVFSFSCDVDVTFYPWDQQACQMWFLIWGYGQEQISVIQINETIFNTYYVDNGVWTLTGSSTGLLPDTATFFFEMHLERKPLFITVNVIAPMMCMSILNVLIFLIPVESGERISYSLTVLLAIAVFLTLVGDNLPKTSAPMSLLSFYLLTVLIVSVCITLATIFSLRLFHCDENEKVGNFWRFVAKCTGCKCKRRQNRKQRKINDKNHKKMNGHISSISSSPNGTGVVDDYVNINFSKAKVWNVRSHYESFEAGGNDRVIYNPEADYKKCRENERDQDEITWPDVSRAMDRVFIVFFLVLIVTLTLSFILWTRNSGLSQTFYDD